MKAGSLLLLLMASGLAACPPYEVRVQVMDELLDKNPGTAVLWLRRGEYHRILGKREEALADLDRARAFDPQLRQVAFQRGLALAELGRNREAENELERFVSRSLEAFKAMPVVQKLLAFGARDLAAKGTNLVDQPGVEGLVWRYQDAELTEMLTEETALPEEARAVRARCLQKEGKNAEAEAELKSLALSQPGPDYVFERVKLMEKEGKAREAIGVLDAAIAVHGQLAVLEDEAVALELSVNEPSNALRRCGALLASRPNESRVERLAASGDCLIRLGRKAEASQAYGAALSSLMARPLRTQQAPPMLALRKHIESALRS